MIRGGCATRKRKQQGDREVALLLLLTDAKTEADSQPIDIVIIRSYIWMN